MSDYLRRVGELMRDAVPTESAAAFHQRQLDQAAKRAQETKEEFDALIAQLSTDAVASLVEHNVEAIPLLVRVPAGPPVQTTRFSRSGGTLHTETLSGPTKLVPRGLGWFVCEISLVGSADYAPDSLAYGITTDRRPFRFTPRDSDRVGNTLSAIAEPQFGPEAGLAHTILLDQNLMRGLASYARGFGPYHITPDAHL